MSSPVPRARALFASATAKGSAATRRTSSWWGRKGLRSAHLGGEWIQGSGGPDSDTHGEAGASACHDGGRRCHDAGPVHGGERGTAAMANDPLAVLALRTHTRSARNREKEGARASTHHWRLLLVLSHWSGPAALRSLLWPSVPLQRSTARVLLVDTPTPDAWLLGAPRTAQSARVATAVPPAVGVCRSPQRGDATRPSPAACHTRPRACPPAADVFRGLHPRAEIWTCACAHPGARRCSGCSACTGRP